MNSCKTEYDEPKSLMHLNLIDAAHPLVPGAIGFARHRGLARTTGLCMPNHMQ
jgi:hypothetical protein